MQFRRSGQRDERRRRVLMDEMLTSPDEQAGADSSGGTVNARAASQPGRIYSEAALAHQPRVTQFVPRRAWTLTVLLLTGLATVAAVESLYGGVYLHLPAVLQARCTALEPTTRGSIGAWLASVWLFSGAFGSLLVYSIRRHRLDDYKGRYRVWIWAAVGLLVGSLDAATDAHRSLDVLVPQWIGSTFAETPWSTMLICTAYGLLLLRMTVEVWSSRLAVGGLCLAAVGYVATTALTLHPATPALASLGVMASSTLLLLAHLCILFSIALYGRHVCLEAQTGKTTGTVRAKKKPKPATSGVPAKATNPSKTTRAGSKSVRIDSAHEKPAAVEKEKASSNQSVATDLDADQSLSRAERRRLRKLERRRNRGLVERED